MLATLESRLAEWFIKFTATGQLGDLNISDLNISDLNDAQENSCLERINGAVDMIEAETSGFSFALDKRLSVYISGYRSLAYVSTHVLSQDLLEKIIGGCYSRLDMMASQSFMISAIQKQHYTLRDGKGKAISTSVNAIPCLLNYDHRILIPFFVKELGHEIYLVCNEFWGTPCGVIDFVDRVYYTDRSSPKMRSDDPSISIRSLVQNLLAWHLAKASESSGLTAIKVNILLGGTVNLSHILWNYLGGIEVLRRTGSLDGEYNLVQISNLLYPINHLPAHPLDLASSDPLGQIIALAKLGMSSGLWIRCSDAGNSPILVRNLLAANRINEAIQPKEHTGQLVMCESLADVSEALRDTKAIRETGRINIDPNEVSIAMQIRCHNRSLKNQELVFAQIIEILSDNLSCLHIILDGSSKGANPQNIHKEQDVACSIQANDMIVNLVREGRLHISTTIGIELVDQLQLYSQINTYLAYASGGLVKFTALSSFAGTAIAPETDHMMSSSHYLQDLDPAFFINHELASYLFSSSTKFLMWHDNIGYGNLNCPVNVLFGKNVDETLGPQDGSRLISREATFDASFVLSAESICLNILRCVVYNRIA